MNDRSRVVLAGGSGFLGISLSRHLASRGFQVVILSRNVPKITGPWEHRIWDGRSASDWRDCLEGAAGVVNLTGRTVDCIKTPDHCDEILRSRVESTLALGTAMRQVPSPPPVWVQMSTAHIYGDPPAAVCVEDSPPGYGLAPTVGQAWESAFARALLPSQRGVILRTSFVIGRNLGAGNGALGRLGLLARWGLGGRAGTGQQGMSWIHELDMNRLFERGLNDPSMSGVYLASAPHPLPQHAFMRELRRVAGGLGRWGIGLPATEAMVRLGARYLLRTDPELGLYGRYVIPRRLADEGFEFQFPHLSEALQDLYRRPGNGPRIA